MKSCDVISLIWFEYTGYSGLDNLKLRATPCSHHRTVIIMPTDILGAKAKAGTSMAGESASDRVNATVPRSYCQMLDRWVAAHAVLCCLTSNDGSKGCYNLPQIVTLLQVCPGLEQTQFHFEHGEPCCSLSLSLSCTHGLILMWWLAAWEQNFSEQWHVLIYPGIHLEEMTSDIHWLQSWLFPAPLRQANKQSDLLPQVNTSCSSLIPSGSPSC